MSYYLQSAYIKILNSIYSLTGKINERSRNRIIFVLFFVMFLYLIFYRAQISSSQIKEILPTQFEKHLFGCLMLILLTIISVNKPLTHVKWRNSILIPQLLLGAGMIVIGFAHPIGPGYQTTGFMLIFLFPCLYLVWNNRGDYDRLFTLLCYAMIAANLFLVLLTVYYALQGEAMMENVRFVGIMNNANGFCLIGLELVLGAMYLLGAHQYKWLISVLLYFIIGLGIGIILLGQMRVAIMVLFLCAVSLLVFCMRNKRGIGYRTILVHLLVGAFFILQGVLLMSPMVLVNNAAIEARTAVEQETSQAVEQEGTPQQSPSIVDRFDVTGKDANSFSSGRVVIWKNYARKLNLLGNNRDNYNIVEMTGIKYPYAHNVFLEVGYRCGVPVGLLAVIMILIPGLIAIRYVFFKKNAERYLLFPIFAVITYAVEALLDCAFLPFFQAEALWYYLALSVFIDTRS